MFSTVASQQEGLWFSSLLGPGVSLCVDFACSLHVRGVFRGHSGFLSQSRNMDVQASLPKDICDLSVICLVKERLKNEMYFFGCATKLKTRAGL